MNNKYLVDHSHYHYEDRSKESLKCRNGFADIMNYIYMNLNLLSIIMEYYGDSI